MLLANRDYVKKYDYLSDKFRICYEFLERPDLAELTETRIDLPGGIFVLLQRYTTIPAAEGRFESHDRYFDIQYVVAGIESFGVADRSALEEAEPYDAKKDATFYHEPALAGQVLLRAGDMAVVPPEIAHKPKGSAGQPAAVVKLVFKVPIE